MTLIAPAAQSLGCRTLKDGLLDMFFLLTIAGLRLLSSSWRIGLSALSPIAARVPRSKHHFKGANR
jgi:hypothetical protein